MTDGEKTALWDRAAAALLSSGRFVEQIDEADSNIEADFDQQTITALSERGHYPISVGRSTVGYGWLLEIRSG